MNDEMRDLLAAMSVLSEAPASTMDPNKTAHQKPGAVEPRSTGQSLYDRAVVRFNAATTASEIERALAWGRSAYNRARRSPTVEMSARQREYWAVVASQGRDYRDVALEYRLNEKTVWKMRSDAGYDPRKGFPKAKKAA